MSRAARSHGEVLESVRRAIAISAPPVPPTADELAADRAAEREAIVWESRGCPTGGAARPMEAS